MRNDNFFVSCTEFHDNLEILFDKYNGSVNFYVFHGGVNYAFTAGGGTDWTDAQNPKATADITSYGKIYISN